MSPPICTPTLEHVLREARIAAARLIRQLRLPGHERDDLSQDLLIDVFARLKSFDPSRGTLGAFAGTVVAHHATRLASRIRRRQDVFALVSLDDLLSRAGSSTADAEGIFNTISQPTSPLAGIELRLDLERAIGALSCSDAALCAQLVERTPTELSRTGTGARASIYRRIREIRLQLLTAGIAAPA